MALIALFIRVGTWKGGHWHIGLGGVTAMAFSPADPHVLVTATSGNMDGLDTLWDVTSPARPRLLRTLAAPVAPPRRAGFSQGDIAFSPGGRLLASAVGRNQVALWNAADPAHATRIATVPGGSGFICNLAFSPRGHLLADVSYNGTVTIYSLANPARPARTATMQTVTARQIADSICTGGCGPGYTLQFGLGGQTLTAVADLSPPSEQALPATAPQPYARNYAFFWNVANPRSVTRTAVLSHPVTISGGSTLPLVNPSGRAIVTGASSGFAVTLWTLP